MSDLPSQSTLNPAGTGAERIAELFYGMVIGGSVIWVIVIALAIYAVFRPAKHDATKTKWLVVGGGAAFPTIVLTGLVSYGLALLPELQSPAPAGSQVIEVAGVRWWWRVKYRLKSGAVVESANEIRVPVGEAIEFKLSSEDVIHSFWIPSLGGKVDMIPGRQNRLKLVPSRPGRYRGVCAEFCGAAHADMAFDVVAMPRDEFETWLDSLVRPTANMESPEAVAGQQVFTRLGCGACHTIRGTSADGVVGPDLTHFASRLSIGAGMLPNTSENLGRWIENTHTVKPGVEMPAFETLTNGQITSLVAYLQQLK